MGARRKPECGEEEEEGEIVEDALQEVMWPDLWDLIDQRQDFGLFPVCVVS